LIGLGSLLKYGDYLSSNYDESDIFFKVGHFTLDNAANNKTMMESLARKLEAREISFDPVDRQIMCFAHVIDLASGRVIRGIEGDNAGSETSNPIGLGRTVVRSIRASGLRRDSFDEVVINGNAKQWFKAGTPPQVVKIQPLQLLRQVRTRWDSVYYMANRLREMRPVS
jgi:hypothetical protein